MKERKLSGLTKEQLVQTVLVDHTITENTLVVSAFFLFLFLLSNGGWVYLSQKLPLFAGTGDILKVILLTSLVYFCYVTHTTTTKLNALIDLLRKSSVISN